MDLMDTKVRGKIKEWRCHIERYSKRQVYKGISTGSGKTNHRTASEDNRGSQATGYTIQHFKKPLKKPVALYN